MAVGDEDAGPIIRGSNDLHNAYLEHKTDRECA